MTAAPTPERHRTYATLRPVALCARRAPALTQLSARLPQFGRTALFHAAGQCRLPLVTRLLSLFPDAAKSQDKIGRAPLHYTRADTPEHVFLALMRANPAAASAPDETEIIQDALFRRGYSAATAVAILDAAPAMTDAAQAEVVLRSAACAELAQALLAGPGADDDSHRSRVRAAATRIFSRMVGVSQMGGDGSDYPRG